MSETPNLPANIESPHDISKTLGNRCPHCGQDFSEEGLNIAVFLYGIFFLVGKEHGYAGITCPSCLNTICHLDSLENTLRAKEILTGPIHLGDSEFDPNLRYFSSAEASPNDIPLISDFNIPYLIHAMNGNEPPSLSERISVYLEDNPHIEEDYLCSYILNEKDAAGTFCYVWWFKRNEIEKLLKIENAKGIKIFPRYYHRCTLIEDVERFCLNYGLFNKSLDDLKNLAKSNLDKLEKHAVYNGIDFNELLDENQDIMNPGIIENIQTDYQIRNDTAILNLPGDFLNILLADPNPWDFEGQINRLCKGFWKTKNPFTTVKLPQSLSQFSSHPFKEVGQSEWLQEAKSTILPVLTKEDVQLYLTQNYAYFISDYVERSKDRAFSYADLWALKEKYLRKLVKLIEEQKDSQSKNKFYRKDGFWVVSYEGNESLIQDLDGLTYIHFLLQNKGKQFTYFDIEKLLNGEVANEDGEDEEVHIESEVIDREFILSLTPQDMITEEFLTEILHEQKIISQKLRKAEKDGNENQYSELNSYLEKIDDFLKDSTYKSKKGKKTKIKIKKFKNSSVYKVKKDNVDRVLNYALYSLQEHNEVAFKHLDVSIHNKKGEIWYEPPSDVDWYTG